MDEDWVLDWIRIGVVPREGRSKHNTRGSYVYIKTGRWIDNGSAGAGEVCTYALWHQSDPKTVPHRNAPHHTTPHYRTW